MRSGRIFSIGYGGRTVGEVTAQIKSAGADFLIDVRSAPYSRYSPDFTRVALAEHATAVGLTYGFMGHQLGGLPSRIDHPELFDATGRVSHERLRTQTFFKRGMERLQRAFQDGHCVCLLCAEAKPEGCHRHKLIGAALHEVGIEMVHLLPDGTSKTWQEVERLRDGAQLQLFGE